MHVAPPIPRPMARQVAIPGLGKVGVVVIVAVAIRVAARKEGSAEKSAVEAISKAVAISKGPLMKVIEVRAEITPKGVVDSTAKTRMEPTKPAVKSAESPAVEAAATSVETTAASEASMGLGGR